MKSYLSLAWKQLRAEKITSLLILCALLLSTIATTAAGASVGILQSLRIRQAAGLHGNRYATFHQLTETQMLQLSGDARLTDVGSLIQIGNCRLGNSSLTLFLREYCGNSLDAYPSIGSIREGHLPSGAGEIALSEDALRYLAPGAGVGDILTLTLSVSLKTDDQPPFEYTFPFTITGILENDYLGYASGTMTAVAGRGTAAALLPERYLLYSADFKTKTTRDFQAIIDSLAEQLTLDKENIQYNWVLLDAMGLDYAEKGEADAGNGFPFMAAACILVGSLVLLASGLVIYNILKVSVARKIREYGTLRAIGGERRQLYRLVTLQLLLLFVIALPPGSLLGILSAKGILLAATGLLNPDLFLAGSTQELHTAITGSRAGALLPVLAGIGITLFFSLIAAFPAARYASRVSPVEAMSGHAATMKRTHRKTGKIRCFEAFYARLNMSRSRGRTAITILSIVMSITVYVALQSFSGLLDTSRAVQEMHLGDYAVTSETAGIRPAAVKELEDREEVAALYTTKLSVYTWDAGGRFPLSLDFTPKSWEAFQIAGIDGGRLESYLPGLSAQTKEALRNGTACLVKNPIPFSFDGQETAFTQLKAGDTLTVNGTPLQVAGIVSTPVTINNAGYINGIQILVSDSLYDTLTGKDSYSEIYPILYGEEKADTFEKWLQEWCDSNPGSHWLSYRQSDAQLAESFEQITLLSWGLILFIGLIGLLNIINTVYTSIHTRVNEIGIQRAIGMSAGSLYRTFLWEGAYYGLIASGIGAVTGWLCTFFVNAAAAEAWQLPPFPLIPVLQASLISVLACLLSTAFPLRSLTKTNIVSTIRSIE